MEVVHKSDFARSSRRLLVQPEVGPVVVIIGNVLREQSMSKKEN